MRTVLPIKNPTAAEPTTNPISSSDRPITLYRNITKILFSMYLKNRKQRHRLQLVPIQGVF